MPSKITLDSVLVIGRGVFPTYYSDEEILVEAVDLLIRAGAQGYVYHTGERFLNDVRMIKKDRSPNLRGRNFLFLMMSKVSGKESLYHKFSCKMFLKRG